VPCRRVHGLSASQAPVVWRSPFFTEPTARASASRLRRARRSAWGTAGLRTPTAHTAVPHKTITGRRAAKVNPSMSQPSFRRRSSATKSGRGSVIVSTRRSLHAVVYRAGSGLRRRMATPGTSIGAWPNQRLPAAKHS